MNRDELLDKLAMEYAPDEWGDAATWTYDEHQFGWNEYQLRRAELINKPSWDDAPEWAQWLAQDEDGEWWWYEDKPKLNHAEGCFDAEGRLESICAGIDDIAGHNWRDTLEQRPQAKIDTKTCKHCDITFQRPHLDSVPDDRCMRRHDEITAIGWDEGEERIDRIAQSDASGDHYAQKSWWTHKPCTLCERQTDAKVSDDRPVCPECVVEDGDPVNHPAHYQSDNGIECIDAIRSALGRDGFIAYCRGNAIKYAWRSDRKGKAAEDKRKAAWYLERAARELEAGQ